MALPPSYRDHYEGRGKYAKQNDAMLIQEQLRLDAWQDESTQYKARVVPTLMVLAALLVVASIFAAVYFLALAG
jgi:hypothetical protein